MQLQYNIGPLPAQPGMRHGATMYQDDIITVIAATVIPFGVVCEFNASGQLQPLQDATTGVSFLPSFAGVSLYDPLGAEQQYVPYAVPPSISGGSTALGYPKGFAVPVLRRGRVWVQFDGVGTFPKDGQIQVWHSSDGSHLQGVLTGSAPQTTVGQEIDHLPTANFMTFDLLGQAGNYTNVFGSTFGVGAISVNVI